MFIEDPQCTWRDERLHSELFDDFYFSPDDGLAESRYVFVEQAGLIERMRSQEHVCIAETGFGTGLNFLASWDAWEQEASPTASLEFVSIQKYPLPAADIRKALARWPALAEKLNALLQIYPIRRAGIYRLQFAEGRIQLTLCFGDVETCLQQLLLRADIWYLDGFSPQQNKGMWSDTVFKLIAASSTENARLSTFTAAGFVRRGLAAQGFAVEKVVGFGKKREMIRAQFTGPAAVNTLEPWFQVPPSEGVSQLARPQRVAIIGGGLAGCSAAYLCAQAGMQVDLYEQAEIAGAASGNPIGLCAPNLSADESPFAHYYFSAWQFARQHFQALQQKSERLFYEELGTRHCLYNDYELQRAQRLITQCCAVDAWAGIIEGASCPYLEIPAVAHVAPRILCEAYVQQEHITRHRQSIASFFYADGEWQLSTTDADLCGQADMLIIANAQAGRAYEQCGHIDVQSVRGQLAFLERPLADQRTALQGEAYLTTAWNGHQIVGATFQRQDDEPHLRQADQDALWQQCRESMHLALAPQTVQGRVSFRSCGPDRMPVLGALVHSEEFLQTFSDLRYGKPHHHYQPITYLPQAYVSLGHGSRGIVGSLFAAQCILDQMRGRTLPCSQDVWKAVASQRFLVRHLKRLKP